MTRTPAGGVLRAAQREGQAHCTPHEDFPLVGPTEAPGGPPRRPQEATPQKKSFGGPFPQTPRPPPGAFEDLTPPRGCTRGNLLRYVRKYTLDHHPTKCVY